MGRQTKSLIFFVSQRLRHPYGGEKGEEERKKRKKREEKKEKNRGMYFFFFVWNQVSFRCLGLLVSLLGFFYGDWFVPNLGFWLRDHTNP